VARRRHRGDLREAAVDERKGVPTDHPRGDKGFVTVAVVDPFGNVLGIMHNPHYLEMLHTSAAV
jgi:hypothetical protein